MTDPALSPQGNQPAGTPPPASTGDGSGSATPAPSWFDSLPEGLKGEPSLQAFKGKPISAIVESHVNAQKVIGGSVRLPKPDAKPEERAKVLNDIYGKLGRPESPDKYTWKKPAVEELELEWSDERVSRFLDRAHKIGLNSEQVQELIDYQVEEAVSNRPDSQEAFEKCIKALEAGDEGSPGWGSTTPRFLGMANRVVSTMFHKGAMDKFKKSGLANDPSFIRDLARLGRELLDSGVIAGDSTGSGPAGMSDAQAELDKMEKDPKHPYRDRNHPDHDEAVQRALQLRQLLSGTF